MIIHSRLNVLFDDPFWVGIFEREYEGRYEAARVVFGAEPKDYEVYEFFIKNYPRLVFGPSLDTVVEEKRRFNQKCVPILFVYVIIGDSFCCFYRFSVDVYFKFIGI